MNRYMYKITVIVPAYNVEDYIQEAIDSVCNQTMKFEDIQIIIVDDCSTDDTLRIIKERYSHYENIEIIECNQSSGAAGRPRNIGIEHTRGEYIMFLDPDDLFEKDAFETLYREITQKGAQISIGSYIQFNEKRSYKHPILKKQLKHPISSVILEGDSDFIKLPPSIWCKIYKTEFIKNHNIKFPEGIACQDAVFMTACFMQAKKVSYIPKSIYRYRLRPTSITNNLKIKYFEDYSKSRKMIIECYAKRPDIDYFEWRYEEDIRFILEKLKQFNNTNIEDKVRIIEILEWFILEEEKVKHSINNEMIRSVIKKVKTQEYKEAVQVLEEGRQESKYFFSIAIAKLKKILFNNLQLGK